MIERIKMFGNTMSTTRICFVLLIGLMLNAEVGVAQVRTVWALGDGEKVFRYDSDHTAKDGNLIWDGESIHIKGLYNEVLAFQVIVETELEGAKGLEVVVDAPVHKESGRVIGGNSLRYGPGGTIELFTQHYLHVTDPTEPQWFYGSEEAAPENMTGWIPDALIPTDARSDLGGFPVDVDAGDSDEGEVQNQGFWIDIYLPRGEERYPSGIYVGNVQVLQEGEVISEIPLEVALLPQYLPDETQTNIWVSSANIRSYFPEFSREEVDKLLKHEGRRHRVDMAGGFRANSSPFDSEMMEEYKPFLDGTAYTPSNGYRGPGEGVGEKLFPVGMYGSQVLGETEAEVQEQSNLWVEWFREHAPDVTYFWYITDEPPESRYPWIRERAAWIKNNPGPGSSLPVFTTTHPQEELSEAIDIWAAYDGVDLDLLPEIRENGGDHWFYNGNRPRYGSVILEGAAVDFRVNSWVLYKYDVNTHFIWESVHWKHNHQGPKGHLHQNVYQEPLTFINNGMNFGNGDGMLFYPGRMPFYPEEDRGLNQVLPSIRLKNIRRGQQDAIIMAMAEEKVGREKVVATISKVLPRALSEVSMDEEVPWSEAGDDYEAVRYELLEMIEGR